MQTTIKGSVGQADFAPGFPVSATTDVVVSVAGTPTAAFTVTPEGHINLNTPLAVASDVNIAQAGDASASMQDRTFVGSVTGVGNLLTVDATGFASVALYVNAVGAGTSFIHEQSPDGTNWYAFPMRYLGGVTTDVANPGGGWGAGVAFVAQVYFRFVRFRVSAGTGTATVSATFKETTQPFIYAIMQQNTNDPLMGTVHVKPVTSGGLSMARVRGAASGAAKAGAGQLYGYEFKNTNAAVRYLQIYDKATAGVPGTDTPKRTIGLAAGGNVTYSTGMGIAFGTGISWAITTDEAGATAGASGDVIGSLDFA